MKKTSYYLFISLIFIVLFWSHCDIDKTFNIILGIIISLFFIVAAICLFLKFFRK